MISDTEIELMKESYSLIYKVENMLRLNIRLEMESFYGLNWYNVAPRQERLPSYKRSFQRLYFHELIPFLVVYPCFRKFASEDIIFSLRQLIPLRNKIAHNVCLNTTEYNLLCKNYKNIKLALDNLNLL